MDSIYYDARLHVETEAPQVGLHMTALFYPRDGAGRTEES